ncbi:MAG: radical SAM protein [bacterium]
MYKYIFGPVPSRRLGVSLGIDVIPHKTCNLDCVYCECGATTNCTVERKSYINFEELINEIGDYFSKDESKKLDYVTFAGSGEPTLNKDIGKIVGEIKKRTMTPLALLTNGTLFFEKKVREDVMEFDLIMPSLDAPDTETFEKINRPNAAINFDEMIHGLVELRKEFSGIIALEVFIIAGLNDSSEQLDKFKKIIQKISPDKIMLNSLDRPPVESWVKPLSASQLEKIRDYFNLGNVEIIKKYKRKELKDDNQASTEHQIINLIKVRPCTIRDISTITGIRTVEVSKYLDVLENEGKLKKIAGERGVFFKFMKK